MKEAKKQQTAPKNATRPFALACRKLLGFEPDRIEYPGGKSRKSAIAVRGDEKWVISRRGTAERAKLEAGVLTELAPYGAPVPRVIACRERWLVQECLPGERLSAALEKTDAGGRTDILYRTAESLARVHDAGRRAGLAARVVTIGTRAGWLERLIAAPAHTGRMIGLAAPALASERLATRLVVREPQFIKWDARPGNALVAADGAVSWFDWEHCGCRDPLDDLAWLLGDEWTPDDEAAENAMLQAHLTQFCGGRGADEALAYLRLFGTLHMAVRLSLIIHYKGDDDWWDHDYCLNHDKIGVTPEGLTRTCRRGARWAQADALTAPLSAWFRDVEHAILRA